MLNSTSQDADLSQMGGAKEFISYYQEEMDRNISAIRKTIVKHSGLKNDQDAIELIVDAGNAISDLAMVYGFETEEAIGRTIAKTAGRGIQRNELEELISRLERSTRTVEDRIVEAQPKPESRQENTTVPPVSAEPAESNPANPEGVGLLFDIKDDGELMSFLQDEDESELPLADDSGEAIVSEHQDHESPDEEVEPSSLGHEQNTPDSPEENPVRQELDSSVEENDAEAVDTSGAPDDMDENKEEMTFIRRISGFFSNK